MDLVLFLSLGLRVGYIFEVRIRQVRLENILPVILTPEIGILDFSSAGMAAMSGDIIKLCSQVHRVRSRLQYP